MDEGHGGIGSPDDLEVLGIVADIALAVDRVKLRRTLAQIADGLPKVLAERLDAAWQRDVLIWSHLVLDEMPWSPLSTARWRLEQAEREPSFFSSAWVDALPLYALFSLEGPAWASMLIANSSHHNWSIRWWVLRNLALIPRRVPGTPEYFSRIKDNLRVRHGNAVEAAWLLLASAAHVDQRRAWLEELVKDFPEEAELSAIRGGIAVPNRLARHVRLSLENAASAWRATVPTGTQEALFRAPTQLSLGGMETRARDRARQELVAVIQANPFLRETVSLEDLLGPAAPA